jgi:hypothetical protein
MTADMDIAITTWPNAPFRFDYFRRTIDSLKMYLTASRHTIRWVCSAENTPDPNFQWAGDDLSLYCERNDIELHWRDAPPNLGANMNAALRLCTALVIWMQQDDWKLLRPLDVSPGIDFILQHTEYDLLRYSYPDNDRMRPRFHPAPDGFREIDRNSTWFYGDDPHLRRPDFMDKWGWYLEGGRHASASSALMTLLKRGRARIAAADQCYFKHFGQTSSYPRDTENREGRRR